MSTKNLATGASPRERLLAAANELFYGEGIHTVGIDRVIEKAGVAKASLYSTFGSKDALVCAYLEGRHAARKARVMKKLATYDTPRARLLGVFDALHDYVGEARFRGCAFLRASAEGRTDRGVRDACEDARAWTRGLFTELATAAGARQPKRLAAELVLLYDGATVSAQMDGNRDAALTARAVAAVLLDAAIAR
jgi:AcrR family transcriptional regulator